MFSEKCVKFHTKTINLNEQDIFLHLFKLYLMECIYMYLKNHFLFIYFLLNVEWMTSQENHYFRSDYSENLALSFVLFFYIPFFCNQSLIVSIFFGHVFSCFFFQNGLPDSFEMRKIQFTPFFFFISYFFFSTLLRFYVICFCIFKGIIYFFIPSSFFYIFLWKKS